MNRKLLYVYVFLVVATVVVTLVMWIMPSNRGSNKYLLQDYLNIQPLTFKNSETGFLSINPASDVVALEIIFKGGSSLEPLNYKGISQILASMMVSSPNDSIKKYLKKYSIVFNAYADFDNVTFKIMSTKDNIAYMFYILNKIINNTQFDNNDLKVVKDNALLNLKLGKHYTSVIGINALYKALFNNPHLTNMQGTEATLNSININSLVEVKKILLTRNNIVVGVSGNISKEQLENELNKIFHTLPLGKEIQFTHKYLNVTPKIINVPIEESTNTDIYIVMNAPQNNNKEELSLEWVNQYLGKGFNSLLMEEVRVKRGLAYSVNSSLINTLYGNFWLIKVTTENAKVKDTIEVIKQVLQCLEDKPYKNIDIKKIKNYMINSYLLNFSDNQSIANILATEALLGSSIESIYNRTNYINKISTKSIDNIVARYITSKDLLIVVAGAQV